MTILYKENVGIYYYCYYLPLCAIIAIVLIEADTILLFMLLLICKCNQIFYTLSFSTKIKFILRISINLFM